MLVMGDGYIGGRYDDDDGVVIMVGICQWLV